MALQIQKRQKQTKKASALPFSFCFFLIFVAQSQSLMAPALPKRCHVTSQCHRRQISSRLLGKKEDLNNEISLVSDAEALLACWSYLKRHKRLGNWTQNERRKSQAASAKPHYFWEEEDEDTEITIDEDEDEEYFDGGDLPQDRLDSSDTNPASEIWFGEFTSFPIEPSVSRTRRSQAAKKTWSDPDFRKRWYEQRWGSDKLKEMSEDERTLDSRVRLLPRDFWGSPELATMSEEEISNAIETYVTSRKLRKASRKKTLQERKPTLDQETEKIEKRLPRDALFTLDQETLKGKQRQRSERAKKAYKNRLENKEEEKPVKRTDRRAFLPSRATPQDAILRIEDDLDRGIFPPVADIHVIMKPMKLGKRKNLLRRILLELFNLRGKCVPLDLEDPSSENMFVTQVSIQDLGIFVIHLLQTRNYDRHIDSSDSNTDKM
jgi:hypothetical protein